MSIYEIRNKWARRAALIAFLPVTAVGLFALGILAWIHDLTLTTADGLRASGPELRDIGQRIADCWKDRK